MTHFSFSKFQFLSGAIKRLGGTSYNQNATQFQFLSGAIKSNFKPKVPSKQKEISIPKWCD